jgi:hypothetical protein
MESSSEYIASDWSVGDSSKVDLRSGLSTSCGMPTIFSRPKAFMESTKQDHESLSSLLDNRCE